LSIAIICDGYKIGGIERIALDQCYQLNSMGEHCEIIVLCEEPKEGEHAFKLSENDLIQSLKVNFIFIPGKRFNQLFKLNNLIKSKKYSILISHSLRGSVMACLIRIIKRYKFKLTTTIHQLPSLSAPVQRTRRMLYSQFTDKLFIFSVPAMQDWNLRRDKNLLLKVLTAKRKVQVCRNGVYLPRLVIPNSTKSSNIFKVSRIIFIGRITAWKGLATFLNISQLPTLNSLKILLITPNFPNEYLVEFDSNFLKRVEIITGKSVSQINFESGDLLLYPANYGPDSSFTEGVSLNVLEMASLGVPSLITKNGGQTWPELLQCGLVKEVDWKNLEKIAKIINTEINFPTFLETNKYREILDIRHNLYLHLDFELN
jgi:glycosyltransferase involved in cell wall biosynthesis